MKIALVVFNNKGREEHVFSDAKLFRDFYYDYKLKNPKATFYTVNRSKITEPPFRYILKQGELWCPYCRAGRVFIEQDFEGIKQCRVCKVTDREYHVSRLNYQLNPYIGEEK